MEKNNISKIKADLSGKVAVVVGGTGSIGREISLALLDSKAKVVVASPEKNNLQNSGNNMFFYPVDVTDEKSVEGLAKKVLAKFKKVDILVLVQGIQQRKPFTNFTLDEWNKIIGVNMTGTFLACKHFSKSMMAKKYGKIIAITSLTTEFGIKNISAYAASKGGMSQFLKTAALELVDYNINVNMIAPGRITTEMTKDIMQNKGLKKSSLDCIPMNRFGKPSDLTGAVLFLASDSSDYMTGQTLFIDGGWLAGCGNPED
jgi:NAD(P)-dependent dehydrogenase (short-subunit alcohol dehydrogenase family)